MHSCGRLIVRSLVAPRATPAERPPIAPIAAQVTLAAFAIMLGACAVETPHLDPGDPGRELSSGKALIGGREAASDPDDPHRLPLDVPSTVFIGNCTAAKVGARQYLTAAHCVIDEDRKAPNYTAGSRIAIYHGVRAPIAKAYHLTVTRAAVFPDYARAVLNGPPDRRLGQCKAEAVDLALVEVAEDTEIPTATIDFATVALDLEIVVGGFGCEHDFNNFNGTGGVIVSDVTVDAELPAPPDARLKLGFTKVHRRNDASFTFRNIDDPFTQFKLCNGDSGGPVYLNDAPDPRNVTGHAFTRIVGVNACGGLTDSTMARLDDASPFTIATCLKEALARPLDDQAPVHEGFTLLCDR